VIQIWLLLAAVTAALGAATYGIHSLKEAGRVECRAEHAEAARMAELRSRERGAISAKAYQQDRTQQASRAREVIRDLERRTYNGTCLSDGVLESLNDHLRKSRAASEPD
jgi:hypothetical protein